ncbi:AraC family transcriptional regulator [Aquibacillus sediminis]|uniref:AraC family transcriptional regulator n=1 Tax=Aquibacillus sediminis TaxID=2574734 RepID=UPI0011099780|nr:AraC family transcriptional regulator [Aquibacillus sediminis]
MKQPNFLPVISQNFEIYHFTSLHSSHTWLKKHNESAKTFSEFNTLDQLHSHDVIELMVMIDGTCDFFCEGKVYSVNRGDVVFIPPYAVHKVTPHDSNNYERIIIKVNPHLMADFQASAPSLTEDFVFLKTQGSHVFHPNQQNFEDSVSLLHELINKIKDGKEDYSFTLQYLLFQVMKIIFHPSSKSPDLHHTKDLDQRLTAILSYIETHLTDTDLNLVNISNHFHLNKYYFSHYFKQHMNVSFYRYVSLKRLSLAMTKIKQNKDSIETIAVQCGFTDYSSFYRLFKKEFTLSPKTLQKKWDTGTGELSHFT